MLRNFPKIKVMHTYLFEILKISIEKMLRKSRVAPPLYNTHPPDTKRILLRQEANFFNESNFEYFNYSLDSGRNWLDFKIELNLKQREFGETYN